MNIMIVLLLFAVILLVYSEIRRILYLKRTRTAAVLAWIYFACIWWYIPRDPYSPILQTSWFLSENLAGGQTLYEQNLAWRRDLSKYRQSVREGTIPIPRYRFNWRGYFRKILEYS